VTPERTALLGGRLALWQPARGQGYRTNADALLLAAFAAPAGGGLVVDLGAGVGAVALALALGAPRARVLLVELDEDACALARANVRENGLEARAEVATGDVLAVARRRAGEAALVVCNPPYVAPGRGRAPAAPRARARMGELGPFVRAARALLGRRGRACFVFPATDALALLAELRAGGLEPKRLRSVHPRVDAPARVVLVEARPAKPGGLVVEPPLVERDQGGPTAELLAILGRNAS
jgi:tRNA1Val (adenine37-N6)-methyltransferase